MPRECRNFNNVGKASGLLLLLLAFLAINPIASSSAFAEEDTEDNYHETSFDNSDDVDDVATLDAAGESTVGISFSPATYYADLAPTNATGQSARIDFSATVNVYMSSGYAVYLKSTSPNLTGVSNSSNIIPSATSAKTYANMDVNTWGYASSVGTAIVDSATYKAVAVSGNGDKLAENTTGNIQTDSRTINLSFATKINDEKPADTYSNTMILSVVSSPLKVSDNWGITEMQLMTSAICTNVKDTNGDGEITAQLKDTRDGKYYWVGKLADGKCWMTQNLDLDLSSAPGETSTGTIKTFTNADTDLNDITSWTPTSGTYTVINSATRLDALTSQRSWSLGDYRITNPTGSSGCGGYNNPKNSAADCPSQFTAYTTPATANGDTNAHYILGNYYSWNAAVAGTGSTVTSTQTQASSSVCPKGWRLPTSGENTGEFRALIAAGSIGSDTVKLTSSPYYFVRGGTINQSTTYLFSGAGDSGAYWSSTQKYSSGNTFYLGFSGTNYVTGSNFYYQTAFGYSVRCLAR